MAIVINGSGTVTGLAVGGLPDGTVDAGTLASNAVTEAKIASSAVVTAKLNDDAVTNAKMANDAITEHELAGSAVVTAAINDDAITAAKLASGVGGRVLQQQRVYLTSATQLGSSGAMHELSTALRVSITPNHANNFLLLECSAWYCSPNTDALTFAKFYDVTNSATVFEPPADGSRDRVHFAQRVKSFDVNDFHTMNFRAIGTAGNTNARTYTIYHRSEAGTIQFLSSALSTGSGVTAPIVFTITEIEA